VDHFWIGLVVAVRLNINTITIADYLYRNDAARGALVARAEAAAKDTSILLKPLTNKSKGISWRDRQRLRVNKRGVGTII
ncbi:MAG: hypothetical protein WKF70_06590, partial [Chitinophagaceae bacterium]